MFVPTGRSVKGRPVVPSGSPRRAATAIIALAQRVRHEGSMRRFGKLRFLPVLLLLLLAGLGRAQGTILVVEVIGSKEGLQGAAATCSLVDSRGNVWIGSDAGLDRLDARGIEAIDLGADVHLVSCLHEQPAGVLWIGHAGGLGRLEEGRFRAVALPEGMSHVRALTKSGEDLLVGTDAGLLRVGPDLGSTRIDFAEPDDWRLAADLVMSLAPHSRLGTLVGTAAGLFALGASGPPELLCRLAGLDTPFDRRAVRATCELPDGTVVLGGQLGSFRFDPERRQLEPLPVADGDGSRLSAIAYSFGPKGELWASSPWSGLWSWNSESRKVDHYALLRKNEGSRRLVPIVFSTALSADGVLWICSPDGLLHLGLLPELPAFRLPADVDRDGRRRVFDLLSDGAGGFYLATSDGLQFLRPDGVLGLIQPDGLEPSTMIQRLDPIGAGRFLALVQGGDVLACGPDPESCEIMPIDLEGGVVALSPLAAGGLVLAGRTGVYRRDEHGTLEPIERRPGESFTGAFEVTAGGLVDGGPAGLWLLTKSGVFRLDPTGTMHRYGALPAADVEVLLPTDNAIAVLPVDERLLLSTTVGLALLDPVLGRCDAIELTEATGRRFGLIHELCRDDRGRIWGLTSSALVEIDLDRNHIRQVEVPRATSNLLLGGLVPGEGGRICLLDGEGFLVLDRVLDRAGSLPPAPTLVELEILGERRSPPPGHRLLALDENEDRITFGVLANDVVARDRLRYSVRLTGLDDDWQELGRDGRIHYGGLEPGRYEFMARASNGAGGWTEPVSLLRFEIGLPIWKRPLVQVGLGLVAGLLLVLALRRQVRVERDRSIALERIVAERTEKLSAKSTELERLYQVVRNINVANSLDELLRRTLEESVSALQADAGRFYLRSEKGWQLGPVLNWRPRAEGGPSAALRAKLEGASVAQAVDRLEEEPGDVEALTAGTGPVTSLMMMLHDGADVEACMLVDFRGRPAPDEEAQRQLVARLYQPVTLAYRRLRLVETAAALNDRKNQLLGAAAHDLRNPITVIGMTAETMKLEVGDEPDLERTLHEIDLIATAGRRMAILVDKLLDISAIESGRVEVDLGEADLAEIVADRVDFFTELARNRRITLAFTDRGLCLPVRADVERIGTALDNLLSNALKYTPAGGNIRVDCERLGALATVSITDDGPGLPPQDVAELFARFRPMSALPQHGETASGLGLAIVKRIVDLHGGRVHADSTLGSGSTFGFTLPLRRGLGPA